MGIKICLDTCVIKDYIDTRNRKSIQLLENLRGQDIPVVASTYSLMELSDQNKDSAFLYNALIKEKKTIRTALNQRSSMSLKKGDLEENAAYIKKAIAALSFVEWLDLDAKAWPLMAEYTKTTNITAPDIIHLTTALLSDCTHLVTQDGSFKKHGNELLERIVSEEGTTVKLSIVDVEKAIKEVNGTNKDTTTK